MKIFRQKRQYQRIEKFVRVNYQLTNESQIRIDCCSRDISERGIRFGLYQYLKVGTSLKLYIYLEDKPEFFCVMGKVVWIKEVEGDYPYEVGVNFDFVTPSFRDKIIEIIKKIS